MFKQRSLRGVLVLASIAVVGCSSGASSPAASAPVTSAPPASSSAAAGEPFAVGFAGPLTGDLAFVGNPYRTGVAAYIDYVNSKGGVNGHRIELKAGDDQDTPAVAAALVTKQVQQDDVLGVMEGGSTTVVGSLSPILDELKVPLITWSCLPDQTFDPLKTKFCYNTAIAASSMGAAQVAYALKLKPNAKILLVPTNNPYGVEWAPAAEKYATANGGSIIATSNVPLTGVDMGSVVNAVAEAKPDVIVSVLNDNQAVSVGQGLAQRGLDSIPLVNYISGSDKATFQTLKSPNFYALRVFPYPDDLSTPGMQEFSEAAKAANVDLSTPLVQDGYFAAYVLLNALSACGDDCTREKLTTTLDSLTVPLNGLAPDPFTFSATNHQGLGSVGVYQADSSGAPKLIDTVPAK